MALIKTFNTLKLNYYGHLNYTPYIDYNTYSVACFIYSIDFLKVCNGQAPPKSLQHTLYTKCNLAKKLKIKITDRQLVCFGIITYFAGAIPVGLCCRFMFSSFVHHLELWDKINDLFICSALYQIKYDLSA